MYFIGTHRFSLHMFSREMKCWDIDEPLRRGQLELSQEHSHGRSRLTVDYIEDMLGTVSDRDGERGHNLAHRRIQECPGHRKFSNEIYRLCRIDETKDLPHCWGPIVRTHCREVLETLFAFALLVSWKTLASYCHLSRIPDDDSSLEGSNI